MGMSNGGINPNTMKSLRNQVKRYAPPQMEPGVRAGDPGGNMIGPPGGGVIARPPSLGGRPFTPGVSPGGQLPPGLGIDPKTGQPIQTGGGVIARPPGLPEVMVKPPVLPGGATAVGGGRGGGSPMDGGGGGPTKFNPVGGGPVPTGDFNTDMGMVGGNMIGPPGGGVIARPPSLGGRPFTPPQMGWPGGSGGILAEPPGMGVKAEPTGQWRGSARFARGGPQPEIADLDNGQPSLSQPDPERLKRLLQGGGGGGGRFGGRPAY